MIDFDRFDHIGIRISDRDASVEFYETLGFGQVADGGFDAGHPVVMLHPSGININLLGPATDRGGENVLMDETRKYPGITHIALQVKDADATEAFVIKQGFSITGRRVFRGVKTIFIRDPDRTVLELVGPGAPVADLIAAQMQDPDS